MSDPKIEDRILELLQEGPMTTTEIHSAFGRNVVGLADTLYTMADLGRIQNGTVRVGVGRPRTIWQLPDSPTVDTADQDTIDLLNGRCERLEKELSAIGDDINRVVKELTSLMAWHPASPQGICSERGAVVLPEAAERLATLLALAIEKAKSWRYAKAELANITAAPETE